MSGLYPVASTMYSTVNSSPLESRTWISPSSSRHSSTEACAWRETGGLVRRGVSQGSSLSRPSAQKRFATASRSSCGSPLNQPGTPTVSSIRGSTKLQSAGAKSGGVVAMHDVDLGSFLVGQEGRPLEGALPAAYDQDSLTAQLLEMDELAGVRPPAGGEVAFDPIRDHAEPGDARRGDHSTGYHAPPAPEGRLETAVGLDEVLHQVLFHRHASPLAEPVGVLQ